MREKYIAILLAFFLGGFGLHRFYLGQPKRGLLYLVFFWTLIPFLVSLLDAFFLFLKEREAFDLQYNSEYYLEDPEQFSLEEKLDGRTKIDDSLHTFSTADEIEKLHNLMLQGIISEREFAECKDRL